MRIVVSLLVLMAILSTPAESKEWPINELPMYDGKHEPNVPQNKKSSEQAAALGWKYLNEGDFDTAIKRFNQAWMFDRENPSAYWGFGIIMGHRSQIENTEKNINESIRLLEIANSKKENDPKIITDLGFSHAMKGDFLKATNRPSIDEYRAARKLYEAAEKIDSTYNQIYGNWTDLEYNAGNCDMARELFQKARKAGLSPTLEYEKKILSCSNNMTLIK